MEIKMKKKILSLILCVTMMLSIASVLTSCGGGGKPDALVIMTENLDGLFNPFYSTSANDGTIVSMTQIGMLTSGYKNGDVTVAYGDNEPVVTKDYMSEYDAASNTTTYTFVIKNGIKFSDGQDLNMEDVLFNIYVYLDPVYTGSSTMYSTDILGLNEYRYQTSDENGDELVASAARSRAQNRIKELINTFIETARLPSGNYDTTVAAMKAAIANRNLSGEYKEAVSTDLSSVTNDQLLKDYEKTLQYFKEELKSDYASAKDSFTEEPYKSTGEFDEITSFMYMEGFVTLKYADKDGKPNADKSKIVEVKRGYSSEIDTMEEAIEHVYNAKINSELHIILSAWATAQKLQTEYLAQATEVVIREKLKDGELANPNISGIVSLGHTTDVKEITIKSAEYGTTTKYTVAHEHDANGSPKNANEYDVLQITINGVDPKAVWNFSFAVAPQHYYAEGNVVDIKNNKFGVKYNNASFMTNEIQSHRNITVPMGAGAYMATNASNADNPSGTEFFSNNVVYFKANNAFLLGQPNIEKIRYQVVSASNALNALEAGTVHYATPQFTQNNINQINNNLKSKGIESVYTDQLGYGYIGINAGKITDINLRKAIMAAMNTNLALGYYSSGMAEKIYYPMSTVSWAYPTDDNNKPKQENEGRDYVHLIFDRETVKDTIKNYMALAGVEAGSSELKIKFTIAGSNLTDHPTYQVFQTAADILNECGWEIEVVPDTNALTKLATGSLAVWAAAWGSTVDPDLYQVYHKNSTATSVLAWGYREILASPDQYPEETAILTDLSNIIDEARETDDRTVRTRLYEEALNYILDLAVELPVYQRKVLYAYNANVIDTSSLPTELNPYSSPLDRIWELKFAE